MLYFRVSLKYMWFEEESQIHVFELKEGLEHNKGRNYLLLSETSREASFSI